MPKLNSYFMSNKWIKWTIHAVAWIIITIFPIYFSLAFDGGNKQRLYLLYLHTVTAAIIFYTGYSWLVPRFFLQQKKLTYFVLVGVLILATFFLNNLVEGIFSLEPGPRGELNEQISNAQNEAVSHRPPLKAIGFYIHFLSSSLISGFAMGLGVIEKLTQNEKRQKELEKEKLNSELAFLKSQVSPHFFFNTLNNIYTLIGIDTEEAQDAVLKLSKLMRYLLYESEDGNSRLSDEINFMNHYIDLMKLRISKKVDLTVEMPGNVPELSIPPLLFIAFIENAFKHGVSYREQSFIHIGMEVNNEQIRFESRNSLGRSGTEGEKKHSGIGLENVKKRLELLYPGTHELQITESTEEFAVRLTINLKK